jgi:hypothetical protein
LALFDARQSFTVPATAGQYAPERLTLAAAAGTITPAINAITAVAESAAANSVTEIWLPKSGAAVPPTDADFFVSAFSVTGASADTFALAGVRGAQIRVRSGGTAGTTVVSATAN